MEKFLALFDTHFGHERKGGKKLPLYDKAAIDATMEFAEDFKPDVVILGGDILDCGALSHWNEQKKLSVENLRIKEDAQLAKEILISRVNALKPKQKVFIIGNHEDWIDELIDKIPALEGFLSVENLLNLDTWKVIPHGDYYSLGKLCFIHGDQIGGATNAALNAVTKYERSIRLGHFHQYTTASKIASTDIKQVKTGICVPGLCRKNPKWLETRPNNWTTGFLWGYVKDNGNFNDYVTIITNGSFIANGKEFKG